MTLIISVGNATQTVMVSDRMLSSARTAVDPDANKLSLLMCRGSRWAVGFTGLAELQRGGRAYLRTHQFIAEALADAAEPDHVGQSVMDRFAVALMDRFDQPDAKPYGLGVLFMGYQEVASGVADLDRRTISARIGPPLEVRSDPVIVTAIGETRAVDPLLLEDLARKASQGISARGLRDFAAHVIRTAADSKHGKGVIGEKCSAILVPIDPATRCSLDYLTDQATSVRRYGNVVDCTPDGPGVVFTDYSFESFGDESAPEHVVVPRVGRNELCPCGSGKKYKKCHYLSPQSEAPTNFEMVVRFKYRPGMELRLPIPAPDRSEIQLPPGSGR